MASWNINSNADFFEDLRKLENVEEIEQKMLEESAPLVIPNMKSALESHNQTGEMVKSIKASKIKKNKSGGVYIVVGPTGQTKKQMTKSGKIVTRKKAERNLEKLTILEYGSSKQKATPIIGKVVQSCEAEVLKKMEEVYNREAGI